MMQVEFMGLPGCGKSTIRRRLAGLLRRKGRDCLSLEEALLASLKKDPDDRVCGRILKAIPGPWAIKLVIPIFNRSRSKLLAQNRFLAANNEAFWAFSKSGQFKRLPPEERALAISRFLETASIYQLISEQLGEKTIVVLDEGFLQRSVSLFLGPGCSREVPDRGSIEAYLDSLPLPEILILVEADIERCRERMDFRSKGLPVRLSGLQPDAITAFLKNCQEHLEGVAKRLENKGKRVVRISNNGPADNAVRELLAKLG